MNKQASNRYGKSPKRNNLKKRLEEETIPKSKPTPKVDTPKVDSLKDKVRKSSKSKLAKGLGVGAVLGGAAYGISKAVSKPKDMEKEAGIRDFAKHMDGVFSNEPNKYKKTKDFLVAGSKKLKKVKGPYKRALASGAAAGGTAGLFTGTVTGTVEGRKRASDKFEKKAQNLPAVVKTRKGNSYEHAGNFSKDTRAKINSLKNAVRSSSAVGNITKGVLMGGTAVGAGALSHAVNKHLNRPVSEAVESTKLRMTGHKRKKES